MKTIKKAVTILMITILSILLLGTAVSAASVRMGASASKATVRK